MHLPSAEVVLNFGNLLLASANLLLTFSLVVYILTHNLWSSVARTFAALMALVSVVYGSDVILSRATNEAAIAAWLKFQWIGIALVPAAYLHFSDALLRTTNASSRPRRAAALFAYVVGALFVLLALGTDLVVAESRSYAPWAAQLSAGPLFWLFGLYFFWASAWGFANTLWARSRALTPTSRRRMSYLVASFAAPGLAVYPYLIFASLPTLLPAWAILALQLVGNTGVAVLTTVMAYSVAFQGTLAPDRVIKRSFLNYLLRGPILGLWVLLLILVVPRVEVVLGAPRETILIFAVVGGIIFYQFLLRVLRPLLDWLAYRRDRDELELLRSVDERLISPSDLQQLLENILTAVCDLQRARNGLVVSLLPGDGTLHAEATCGDRERNGAILQALTPAELAALQAHPALGSDPTTWAARDGYRLLPLRGEDPGSMLGFLIVEPGGDGQPPTAREREILHQYIHQAEVALQDRRLQQTLFGLLQQLQPQMETLQRWRSTTPFPNGALGRPETSIHPIHDENFTQMVRQALSDYWGGPKLTESPLLALSVVRAKVAENDNNPARALRAVLSEALDALKPPGERAMTTPEWLLYNILDLKYVQGRRARDVAARLAMSESDLYRKQRAAIDELAKTISKMEDEVQQEAVGS